MRSATDARQDIGGDVFAVSDESPPLETWYSAAPNVTLCVQKLNATGFDVTEPEAVVTEDFGSVTIKSSSTLEWESAAEGGLRFQYSLSPAVFLVGYGVRRALAPEKVIEGFYHFAGRSIGIQDLAHAYIPYRSFPALLGWEQQPFIVVEHDPSRTRPPRIVSVEQPRRRYWTGWGFGEEIRLGGMGVAKPVRGVREALLDLFADVLEEEFEFGEEARFDTQLASLLAGADQTGPATLLEILMESDVLSREATVRAVRVVARSGAVGSTQQRLRFLTAVLGHRQASIRDAAALSLLDLGTPDVIPALRAALAKEKHPQVHKNLIQIVEALDRRTS